MGEGGVELWFSFLIIILGIGGERGREKGGVSGRRKKKKRVIIEKRECGCGCERCSSVQGRRC